MMITPASRFPHKSILYVSCAPAQVTGRPMPRPSYVCFGVSGSEERKPVSTLYIFGKFYAFGFVKT